MDKRQIVQSNPSSLSASLSFSSQEVALVSFKKLLASESDFGENFLLAKEYLEYAQEKQWDDLEDVVMKYVRKVEDEDTSVDIERRAYGEITITPKKITVTAHLYHATGIGHLKSIAETGLLTDRSGKGGFTDQAGSISQDTSTQAKRQETSKKKIHFGNYQMVGNYFNPFKMQPELDKVIIPKYQLKLQALKEKDSKVKEFQVRSQLMAEVQQDSEVLAAKERLLGPKAMLVIHEPFDQAQYYDNDPDESNTRGLRAVRKSIDVGPEKLFVLVTGGEVSLLVYVKSPESFVLFNPYTMEGTDHSEEDDILEEFVKLFPSDTL